MRSCKDWQEVQNEVTKSPSTVLFISSKDCSVCVAVHAKLSQLEKEFPRALFLTGKLDEIPRLSGSYMVFTVPTVLVFDQGKEIHRESRFIDWTRLVKYLP